jgi:hypothetical protein
VITVSDRLTEKITQTLIANGVLVDPEGLAGKLVATFRQHRMNLPVHTTADQRIQRGIRQRGQRIRARRRPSLAFLASLRRRG